VADGNLKTEISRNELENTASNVLFTQIADDAGNVASITTGALDVNASVTIETAYVDDSAFTIGTDKVNAQGFLADETATDSVDEGDIGLARMTLDRRMITSSEQSGTWDIGTVTTLTGITNVVSVDDNAGSLTIDNSTLAVVGGGTEATALRVTIANDSTGLLSIDDNGGSITVDGSVTVSATDLDIRSLTHVSDSVSIGDGTDTLAVNTDGSINVVFGVAATGSEVCDYDTANVASAATSNHDYTVQNTTFLCDRVSFGGSGRMKVEIQSGPVASLVTKAVRFTKRDTSDDQVFDPALVVPVASTGTLRVIRTNRSAGTLDVYSSILGNDI